MSKNPAFRVALPPSFWWTVNVPVATDDDYDVLSLKLNFKRLPATAVELWKGPRKGELKPGEVPQPLPLDREICHQVVTGWQDVVGPDGSDMPFSREALDHVLDLFDGLEQNVVITYMTALRGGAARKNG